MHYNPPYTSNISNKERAKIIGNRMQELRNKANLSQKEICEYLRTTPQTYSGYENGKHEPSIETLIRLSFLFDVTMDYITGRWTNIDNENEIDDYVKNIHENERFIDIITTEIEEEKRFKMLIEQSLNKQ